MGLNDQKEGRNREIADSHMFPFFLEEIYRRSTLALYIELLMKLPKIWECSFK